MTLEAALQALATAEADIEAKQVEIDGKDTEIATLTESKDALFARVNTLTDEASAKDSEIEDAVATAVSDKTEIFEHAVGVVVKVGASSETLMEAVKADSKEGVDSIVLNAMGSEGTSFKNNGGEQDDKAESDALLAFAQKNKIKG